MTKRKDLQPHFGEKDAIIKFQNIDLKRKREKMGLVVGKASKYGNNQTVFRTKKNMFGISIYPIW